MRVQLGLRERLDREGSRVLPFLWGPHLPLINQCHCTQSSHKSRQQLTGKTRETDGGIPKKRKRVRSITWPVKLAKTSCNDSITFQLQPRTDNLSTTNSGTRCCHVCVCRRRTSSLQWLQSVSPLLTSFSSPLSPRPVLLRNLGCHFGRDRYHERPCFSDFVVYKKRNIFFSAEE